jgi:hypothetical protein
MATARLCLKARPTSAQLADRLRAVDGQWPDGVELYLAAADLAELDSVIARIKAADVPDDFAWLIEGPVDSLDGGDFDVTRQSPADREVVQRLAELAMRINAHAVNIHVIAPSPDIRRLTLACRSELLEHSVSFLKEFVAATRQAGAVPTIENMPPVLRMRRSDFAFTPIGMASADLRWLTERISGLRVMPDTSHAGLYLNARRLAPDPQHGWSEPLHAYLQQLPKEPPDLLGYIKSLPEVENAQVSNASGVLGEGLPYSGGDFDLDPTIAWFKTYARHVVTETIEDRNDDAVHMRDALRRMRTVLA